jgi:hypothetical protein
MFRTAAENFHCNFNAVNPLQRIFQKSARFNLRPCSNRNEHSRNKNGLARDRKMTVLNRKVHNRNIPATIKTQEAKKSIIPA